MSVGIVGGGFWGSAISLRLRELGIASTVYDDGAADGASRAAAGICKLSWYRQATVRGMAEGTFDFDQFRDGFDWLRDRLPIRSVPETFVNLMRGKTSVHSDNYLVDPSSLLVPADVTDPVLRVEIDGSHATVVTSAGDRRHDAVIVAAGYRTDDLLDESDLGRPTGVRPLYGRAILFDAETPADQPECVTVMSRPYSHFTFRRFRGGWRGGDTVERRTVDPARVAALVALAYDHVAPPSNVVTIGGTRPVCDRMYVGRVAGPVYAATGGHRVGLGLSGAVALRVGRMLG